MSQSRSRRRTPVEWQQIIDQWQASGLSAREFCRQQSLGYANFRKWCKRLANPESQRAASQFIELGSLTKGETSAWQIVLDLGEGIQLRLSRG